MSTLLVSCLSPPVIRMEQMTHRVVTGTFQGYFQEFGVSPSWFIRGWVRLAPIVPENQTIEGPGTAIHLETEHIVIRWLREQALLGIPLGGREVLVEPMNGKTWDQIIFYPSAHSLLRVEKEDQLQNNGF